MRDRRAYRRPATKSAWRIAVVGLCLTGCATSPGSLIWSGASFPPQHVMQTGDYASFLRENQRKLRSCGGWSACDVVLFNLGFIYAYPPSPYHNPRKARRYLEELRSRYPHSPWFPQGQLLLAFMDERGAAEERQRRLQAELRVREATIQKLREQLDRSREIDIEMERKERELLR